MPIFEYTCSACAADFEKLVFGSATVTCPRCASDLVVKKFSTFGMKGVQQTSSCSSCSSGSCSSCK